ncbi:hypothetical protein FEM48_Zijuj11G0143000 [Ziziphus jujuba var. spinosa]|uniref:Ankyrin repeat-containing protein ITN1-like n=1 Tax=Ziziphus jujuba var. spinosa TaxID=714518 RepID=A0A978UJF5_ZIZJJ|nr:hypothetical protein FEM48_Zijuj11G0143000 [Ziziphus jujuba var. spinosa]
MGSVQGLVTEPYRGAFEGDWERMKRSCLQLLTNMPSAFKSGYPMNKFESFIYSCLPNNEYNDDKCDQMNLGHRNDLESGRGKIHLHPSCSLSFNRVPWSFLFLQIHQNQPPSSSAVLLTTTILGPSIWPTNWQPPRGSTPFPNLGIHDGPREHQNAFFNIIRAFSLGLLPTQITITSLYSSLWMFLCAGNIQNEKKKHESSWKLDKLLIKKDKSWEKTDIKPDIGIISFGKTEESESEKPLVLGKKEDEEEKDDYIPSPLILTNTTPLLIATSTGIEEIVNGILDEYPQAVKHVSDQGLSIMHVAIRHRQRNIFERVRKMKIPMARLVRRIDDNGYTLLHHVADMTHYSGRSLSNPSLLLQDELKWFEE